MNIRRDFRRQKLYPFT